MTTTTMIAPETAPTTTTTLELAPKVLADALAIVKPATGSRSAIAALAGVRIYTRRGVAYMETTDMEVTARRRLDAIVSGDFDALVSHADIARAAKLYAKRESVRLEPAPRVLESFDSEPVVEREVRAGKFAGFIDAAQWHYRNGETRKRGAGRDVLAFIAEVERIAALPPRTANDVRVTDGKRTITLPSLRMADFPEFPIGMETPLLYTDRASDLAAVLERAARFASKDETRPILTGIAFNYAGEQTRVWSTDSYRLADLAAPGHSTHRPKPENARDAIVNIPARGLVMAAKMMRKLDAPVSISTVNAKVGALSRGQYAVVRHDGMEWAMRTIDGSYPQFDQLVPDSHELEVKMPTTALAGACEVAVAFARKNAPMRLSVNGVVKVTGSTPDVADFEELLDGATYTRAGDVLARTIVESNGAGVAPSIVPESPALDDEFIVGLNPEFAADIAKVYVSDEVTIRLISALRPVLYIDGEDRYLQMPIRLNV